MPIHDSDRPVGQSRVQLFFDREIDPTGTVRGFAEVGRAGLDIDP